MRAPSIQTVIKEGAGTPGRSVKHERCEVCHAERVTYTNGRIIEWHESTCAPLRDAVKRIEKLEGDVEDLKNGMAVIEDWLGIEE